MLKLRKIYEKILYYLLRGQYILLEVIEKYKSNVNYKDLSNDFNLYLSIEF